MNLIYLFIIGFNFYFYNQSLNKGDTLFAIINALAVSMALLGFILHLYTKSMKKRQS